MPFLRLGGLRHWFSVIILSETFVGNLLHMLANYYSHHPSLWARRATADGTTSGEQQIIINQLCSPNMPDYVLFRILIVLHSYKPFILSVVLFLWRNYLIKSLFRQLI